MHPVGHGDPPPREHPCTPKNAVVKGHSGVRGLHREAQIGVHSRLRWNTRRAGRNERSREQRRDTPRLHRAHASKERFWKTLERMRWKRKSAAPHGHRAFALSRLRVCAFSSGREDLNLRPPGPEPGALPGCATPREARFIPRHAVQVKDNPLPQPDAERLKNLRESCPSLPLPQPTTSCAWCVPRRRIRARRWRWCRRGH